MIRCGCVSGPMRRVCMAGLLMARCLRMNLGRLRRWSSSRGGWTRDVLNKANHDLVDEGFVDDRQRPDRLVATILIITASSLVLCTSYSLVRAWHWPLFGDAGIFHYIVFLIKNGKVPYLEIKDINLPGTYALDALAMSIYGPGARGERAYDLSLCFVACFSTTLSARSGFWGRLCGLSAGLIFVLIHLQDGLAEAGQRDFAMACLALIAYAILVRGEGRSWVHVVLFEFIIGFTLTIKPTLLPLAAAPVLFAYNRPGRVPNLSGRHLTFALLALSVAPAGTFLWLWRLGSLHSFLGSLTSVGVLHGQLARQSLGFLLIHSMSPVMVLFGIWLVVMFLSKIRWTVERRVLLFCIVCGFLSYYAQGKGLSYQRYPFLAFSLVLIFSDFYDAAILSRWSRSFALSGFVLAGLLFAPKFAWSVGRFDTAVPFEQALTTALRESVAVKGQSIQCLDTFSGCLTALYQLQAVQSTGYLYDCYFFTSSSEVRDQYRAQFLAELKATRPKAIVLTDELCFAEHQGFDWIESWPDLASYLHGSYSLHQEWSSQLTYRMWNRPQRPTAFRLYLEK